MYVYTGNYNTMEYSKIAWYTYITEFTVKELHVYLFNVFNKHPWLGDGSGDICSTLHRVLLLETDLWQKQVPLPISRVYSYKQ